MPIDLQGIRHVGARVALLPVALGVFVANAACAQGGGAEREPSVIQVSGQASVSRAPDEARLIVGVTTEASQSQRAATENARKLAAVLEALRAVAGEGTEIRTSGYTLAPKYRYREDSQREIVGYTASNAVEIRTPALDSVGELIEASTSAGANDVRGLQFELADDISARADALREATRRARTKADAIAEALGVEVGRVLSASEGGVAAPRPEFFQRSRAMAESQPAPIEPGQLEVHASVTLRFEVQP